MAVQTEAGPSAVAEHIRRRGARATPARVRVLRLLREAPAPLSHAEIEVRLGDMAIDRVTLYRVLDWLVDSGLAHKSADAGRVFRFSAMDLTAEERHTIHGNNERIRLDTACRAVEFFTRVMKKC